jgi:hypothetical protein
VAAQLRNEAGIVGAAMVGLERENEMLREEQDVAERGRPDPPPAPLKVVPSVPAAEAG